MPMTLPPLKERLQAALTEAMRSRDKTAIAVLRTALAAIGNSEVTEREAAADSYDASGQTTRARGLRTEARILAGFLVS
jgi:uncharacterized protein YqeY